MWHFLLVISDCEYFCIVFSDIELWSIFLFLFEVRLLFILEVVKTRIRRSAIDNLIGENIHTRGTTWTIIASILHCLFLNAHMHIVNTWFTRVKAFVFLQADMLRIHLNLLYYILVFIVLGDLIIPHEANQISVNHYRPKSFLNYQNALQLFRTRIAFPSLLESILWTINRNINIPIPVSLEKWLRKD